MKIKYCTAANCHHKLYYTVKNMTYRSFVKWRNWYFNTWPGSFRGSLLTNVTPQAHIYPWICIPETFDLPFRRNHNSPLDALSYTLYSLISPLTRNFWVDLYWWWGQIEISYADGNELIKNFSPINLQSCNWVNLFGYKSRWKVNSVFCFSQ